MTHPAKGESEALPCDMGQRRDGYILRSTRNVQDSVSCSPANGSLMRWIKRFIFSKLISFSRSSQFKMDDPKEPSVVALCGNYAAARDPRNEMTWEPLDAENPRNWSLWYRVFIVASMSFSTTIV
jgi:hypothetical protein